MNCWISSRIWNAEEVEAAFAETTPGAGYFFCSFASFSR